MNLSVIGGSVRVTVSITVFGETTVVGLLVTVMVEVAAGSVTVVISGLGQFPLEGVGVGVGVVVVCLVVIGGGGGGGRIEAAVVYIVVVRGRGEGGIEVVLVVCIVVIVVIVVVVFGGRVHPQSDVIVIVVMTV